jgi:hypothetical protein
MPFSNSESTTAGNVAHPNPILADEKKKRGRGRPPKVIDPAFLAEAFDPGRRIGMSLLAKKMGIHRNTLRKYLKLYGIDKKFAQLSDQELDALIRHFRNEHPGSGIRYIMGFLRKRKIRIQRARVAASMNRVDPLRTLRQKIRQKIRRREYRVKRPNALWHIDGHHKLILWGIVIHGVVDRYSRTVSSYI